MADIKTMSNKVAAPHQLDAVAAIGRRGDLITHLMVVMVPHQGNRSQPPTG